MSYNKIDNIFDFVAEFNSKEQSDEWIDFFNNFNDFLEQIKPYIFPSKNGKYKSINLKNQKKLKTLFEKTMESTNKYLGTDPEDEVDKIRHGIVQKLNDEFLLKFSDRIQNLDEQKRSKLKNENDSKTNEPEKKHLKKSVAKIFGLENLFKEPVEDYEVLNDSSKAKTQIRVNIDENEIFDENLEEKLKNEKTPEQVANLKFVDYLCDSKQKNSTNKKLSKRAKKKSKFDKPKKDEEVDEKKLEDPDEEIMRQTLVIMGMGVIASEIAKKTVSFDDIIFSSILVGMDVSTASIDIATYGLKTIQGEIREFVKAKILKKNKMKSEAEAEQNLDLLNLGDKEKVSVKIDEKQEEVEEQLEVPEENLAEVVEIKNENQLTVDFDEEVELTNMLNTTQTEKALETENQITEPKINEKIIKMD